MKTSVYDYLKLDRTVMGQPLAQAVRVFSEAASKAVVMAGLSVVTH